MKKIKLTQGQFALVDDADFEELSKYKWSACWDKTVNNFYSYGRPFKKKKRVSMHRFIMGEPKGKTVDHINRDTLDNRRKNLRICSNEESNRNQGIRTDNSTGYKGVDFHKATKKYQARIQTKEVGRINLGVFKTVEEAAKEYNKAAIKYHGQFAVLNKIN